MGYLDDLVDFWLRSPRGQEVRRTREDWQAVEQLWRASFLGQKGLDGFALALVSHLMATCSLPEPLFVPLFEATYDISALEEIGFIDPVWSVIENDLTEAVAFRALIARRRRWVADFDAQQRVFQKYVLGAWEALAKAVPELPKSASDGDASFEVPLVELLDRPAEIIETLIVYPFAEEPSRNQLFQRLQRKLQLNLLRASGLPSSAPWSTNAARVVMPTGQRNKTPAELADLYLADTPFAPVLELPMPFSIPQDIRFEHAHIVGGTGHGKTQLMQRMIHADLFAAQRERRSVVVIDSQGDLINKLVRLDLFSPDEPNSLADRLVVIDPADVEFPAALNLFDAHLDRLQDYRPVDRERVLNGVVELYEVFFGDLLGAELTQKQGVIFKYLARLMLTIPGATIHTLMQLMEDGKPFRRYMDELDGSARYFFQSEFFHPSFAATKRQILKRLWGVLSTPAFERMFAQKANKLDLFQALNDGKIVLINTAKDLLKQDGSQLFGRFFIALLAQAALERSTLPDEERTPTFVYVDEAQEYFDDRIETILNQARKYRLGVTLAHQTLDQLTPRLRSAIHANTSMKCAGGVSARDARALADELHTSSDFIASMRRRGGRTEFAIWLKQLTPQAIRLSVPLGFLEGQPILTEESYARLIADNRARYCGTLDNVLQAGLRAVEPAPTQPSDEVVEPRLSPEISSAPTPFERPHDEPVRAPAQSPRRASVEPGKGGPQHKYVQHLIKQLAEERGLRAVIEEAVDGGYVDVGLHQGEVSIACEISITSTPEYETLNLAKCLRAGFGRIWAIAPDAKRRQAVRQAAQARLSPEELSKIEFFTTEEMVLALDALLVPEPEDTIVKGYRVRTTIKSISPAEAKERRATIARVLSQSTRKMDA